MHTTTSHTGTSSHQQGHRSFGRYVAWATTATAVGLSALSIALAAPAAAKGPHPGPVIDRPEPTSSVSAQTNAGRMSTAPMRPPAARHPAPSLDLSRRFRSARSSTPEAPTT